MAAERDICGKVSDESCMAIPVGEPYEAPTTSYWDNISAAIPYNYMANRSQVRETNDHLVQYKRVRYPSTKKSGFRLKKIYSTRARGRSGPLQSLARKICRFKVRTIILGDNTTAKSQSDQTK